MAIMLTFLFTCLCAFTVHALKYPVTFEDALLHRYMPNTFNGTWISSNEYTFYNNEYSVLKHNVEANETTMFVNDTVLDSIGMANVFVSADAKWVAVEHNKKSIFRHSTTSLYTLVEISSGRHIEIANGSRIQLLVWAPTGSGVAFVMDNDVYYQSEEDRKSNDTQPTYKRITKSARDIYNGVADWVYEEEVLEDTRALWFSPNGEKLIFATINDTKVRNVTFWNYGDPSSLDTQYVQPVVIKYPKVGTINPVAHINYVDLQSDELKPVKINAPEDLVTSDNILSSVNWVDNDHFSVTWLERLQTNGYTLVCPTATPTDCKVVYNYQESQGWLDIEEPVWINSTTFLTVLPQYQGGVFGNYRQLSMVQDNKGTRLTSGHSVVTSIDCYDKKNNIVYYTSTVYGNSAKKMVYKMNLNNNEKECYSCQGRKDCVSGTAYFSKECAYAVLTCKGPDVPEFNVYDKDGKLMQPLDNNTNLKKDLTTVEIPTKMDLTVPVGEFTIRVRLLLPPGMDDSGQTKYPVLFSVYSGPDTNKISDAWAEPGWDEYLVTRRNIIVVYLDGRGSGLRGDKLKFAIYHQLGGPEIDDILIVGQHIQEKFPFVDPLRTGIWGWSYGGFATAMVLAKDYKNIFRCGISVAPVTNWIYYDTFYTERFMGLPTEDGNLDGYLRSSVSANVTNFRHKLFYLIHGNADDNVHYQQSMVLSRALELADILFFQQSYPDETHSLSHVRRHLFHSMDRFWTRCFHLNVSESLNAMNLRVLQNLSEESSEE